MSKDETEIKKIMQFHVQQAPSEQELFALKLHNIRGVLPDAIIQEIRSVSDLTNLIRWKLGDLVNKVYAVLQREGLGDLMDACWYVSIETGEFRSQNTLRGYASTAAFYNRAYRKMYRHDLLPFAHFRFAKSLEGEVSGGGAVLEMWQVCLQYSLDYVMQHGFPTSEKHLRETFAPYVAPDPILQDTPGSNLTTGGPTGPLTGSDPIPDTPDLDGDASSVLVRFIHLTRGLLDLLPLMGGMLPDDLHHTLVSDLARLLAELKSK